MLRFQLISDIHGNFSRVKWDEDADVVLCAGDVSENPVEAIKFLKQSPNPIIYIPGNHEFYKGNFVDRLDYLREECEKSNGHITFADNGIFQIEDTRIISTTLWSNFNHIDPILITSSESKMNDYNYINVDGFFEKFPHLWDKYLAIVEEYKMSVRAVLRGENPYNQKLLSDFFKNLRLKHKLTNYKNIKEMLDNLPYPERASHFNPLISSLLFKENLEFLNKNLETYHTGKTIVMTHHAPSYTALSMGRYAVDFNSISMEPILRRTVSTNKIGAYASQLERLAAENKIDAWVHGHLHDRMLYRLGSAAVHCNATGISKNKESRRGLNTYCFYLDKETKIKGLINLLTHTRYMTKKINHFLRYIIENNLFNLFEDINWLRAISRENYYLVNTLRTLPKEEMKIDLNYFKTFRELCNEETDLNIIIKRIIDQNSDLYIQLDLWLQDLKKCFN